MLKIPSKKENNLDFDDSNQIFERLKEINKSIELDNMKEELTSIKPIGIKKTNKDNLKIITLMIPCYNEEKGLPEVINNIPHKRLEDLGYEVDVLVINNNSKDNTEQVGKSLGARVVNELRQGKGRAIKTGFNNIHPQAKYVLMLDGDGTYKPHEIPRMIEPLESNFCDVVIGSRLEGKMNGKSMQFSHRVANWFFTFITRRFYLTNVTDTCTGYFAWTRHAVDVLNGYITSKGFAIEAEMITKMARLGLKTYSVPITYDPRHGDSKLVPIVDGIKITRMLFKNINWKPNYRQLIRRLNRLQEERRTLYGGK